MSQPLEFDPSNVDLSQCGSSTQADHRCVHDWRIFWGNVPRQEEE